MSVGLLIQSVESLKSINRFPGNGGALPQDSNMEICLNFQLAALPYNFQTQDCTIYSCLSFQYAGLAYRFQNQHIKSCLSFQLTGQISDSSVLTIT